jgi:hypothetical protein
MEKRLYERFYEVETAHWWFVARKAIVLSLLDRYLPEKCHIPSDLVVNL